MKGSILEFNDTTRQGVISGDDGNRYELDIAEWKSSEIPKNGMNVDFAIQDNKATAVYCESKQGYSGKKIPAAILALFLGAFGVHKFYLGYKKQGLIMLLVCIFGFILLGIPSMIIGIIAFIEFIIYLCKSDEDFDRIYVDGKKGWF